MTRYTTRLTAAEETLLIGLLGTQPNGTIIRVSDYPSLGWMIVNETYEGKSVWATRRKVDQLDQVTITRR